MAWKTYRVYVDISVNGPSTEKAFVRGVQSILDDRVTSLMSWAGHEVGALRVVVKSKSDVAKQDAKKKARHKAAVARKVAKAQLAFRQKREAEKMMWRAAYAAQFPESPNPYDD